MARLSRICQNSSQKFMQPLWIEDEICLTTNRQTQGAPAGGRRVREYCGALPERASLRAECQPSLLLLCRPVHSPRCGKGESGYESIGVGQSHVCPVFLPLCGCGGLDPAVRKGEELNRHRG